MDDAMEVFFSAWGDTDPESRREKLERALSPDFSYVDPNAPGHLKDFDALDAYVAMFGQMMPGATAEVADFTEHHGHARATVNFLKDGKTMMQGQYYGRFAHGGQLAHLVGFNGTGA
jgi:hypothetical protein